MVESARTTRASQLDRAERNLGLLASLGLVLAAILKVMVVSHGSTVTARALLAETDTVHVATGIALLSLPMIAVATIVAVAGHAGAREEGSALRLPEDAVVLALAAIAVATAGWTMSTLVVAAALILRFRLGPWLARRREQEERARAAAGRPALPSVRLQMAGVVGLIAFVFLVADDRPWLPAESMLVHGQRLTGYALSENAGEVVILIDSHRAVVRLPSSAVLRDGYCSKQDFLSAGSVPIFRTPGYPECPNTNVPIGRLAPEHPRVRSTPTTTRPSTTTSSAVPGPTTSPSNP